MRNKYINKLILVLLVLLICVYASACNKINTGTVVGPVGDGGKPTITDRPDSEVEPTSPLPIIDDTEVVEPKDTEDDDAQGDIDEDTPTPTQNPSEPYVSPGLNPYDDNTDIETNPVDIGVEHSSGKQNAKEKFVEFSYYSDCGALVKYQKMLDNVEILEFVYGVADNNADSYLKELNGTPCISIGYKYSDVMSSSDAFYILKSVVNNLGILDEEYIMQSGEEGIRFVVEKSVYEIKKAQFIDSCEAQYKLEIDVKDGPVQKVMYSTSFSEVYVWLRDNYETISNYADALYKLELGEQNKMMLYNLMTGNTSRVKVYELDSKNEFKNYIVTSVQIYLDFVSTWNGLDNVTKDTFYIMELGNIKVEKTEKSVKIIMPTFINGYSPYENIEAFFISFHSSMFGGSGGFYSDAGNNIYCYLSLSEYNDMLTKLHDKLYGYFDGKIEIYGETVKIRDCDTLQGLDASIYNLGILNILYNTLSGEKPAGTEYRIATYNSSGLIEKVVRYSTNFGNIAIMDNVEYGTLDDNQKKSLSDIKSMQYNLIENNEQVGFNFERFAVVQSDDYVMQDALISEALSKMKFDGENVISVHGIDNRTLAYVFQIIKEISVYTPNIVDVTGYDSIDIILNGCDNDKLFEYIKGENNKLMVECREHGVSVTESGIDMDGSDIPSEYTQKVHDYIKKMEALNAMFSREE